MVEKGFLPDWFLSIPARIAAIQKRDTGYRENAVIIGGGTDLMVRDADRLYESGLTFVRSEHPGKIVSHDGICTTDATTTVSELMHSPVFQSFIPDLQKFFRLIL